MKQLLKENQILFQLNPHKVAALSLFHLDVFPTPRSLIILFWHLRSSIFLKKKRRPKFAMKTIEQ